MKERFMRVVSVLLVLGLLGFGMGTFSQKKSNVELKLKEDIVTYKYGEKISMNPKDYLENDDDVLSEVSFSHGFVKDNLGNVVPGTYSLSFSYRDSHAVVDIYVKDK